MEASLADRLQAFANEVRRLAPPFAATVEALIERLLDSGAGRAAPKGSAPTG